METDSELSSLNDSKGAAVKVEEEDSDKSIKPTEKKSECERERKNRWDNSRPSEAKKRQRSPSERRKSSPPPAKKPDDEPDYDDKSVILSWSKYII